MVKQYGHVVLSIGNRGGFYNETAAWMYEQLACTRAGQNCHIGRWSIHCSETSDWYARVSGPYYGSTPYQVGPFSSADEAQAYLDAIVADMTATEERRLQQQAETEALLARERAERKVVAATRTVADVLRDPIQRTRAFALAQKGKTSSAQMEEFAGRKVVRQAVVIMAARLQRRADRTAAGQTVAVNRIAVLAGERLLDRTREAVLQAARGNYRTARAGDHTVSVRFGAPSADGESSKGDRYSSRCTFRRTNSQHAFVVREDWLRTVYDRDLEELDGMVTLAAEPVPGHGHELYRAVWVEQGSGFSLKTERGYIARSGSVAYHAANARSALTGLSRKLGQTPARRAIDLDRLTRRHGQLEVTLADSVITGNCESGTRSWCQAVGIDPDKPCTLADVITGYRMRPLADAIKVIRHVARTHQQRQVVESEQLASVAPTVALLIGSGAPAGIVHDAAVEAGVSL